MNKEVLDSILPTMDTNDIVELVHNHLYRLRVIENKDCEDVKVEYGLNEDIEDNSRKELINALYKTNEKKISTRYKNGVYKYLKAIMNFGTKWYDLNFVKVYNKMTNFTNPNERKKEMSFYTPEEFQKFLSVEDDLKWICLFQTLFYCGLRNGELRGLTWNDINFNKSCLSVNKNITKST